ncbi:hypothetical protein G6F40_015421 [Rhizopus arrhizus]|nr:hypothetical protein G6F40_015421 [Rhizopus arrhizus]
MLAAVVAAQASNSTSSGNATMAAISSGMGLMQQRQINYTRSNESEADRLGIRTLARSGYDVDAMAGFFERMAAAMRGNEGGYSRSQGPCRADEEGHGAADHQHPQRRTQGAGGPG